jgi:transmembrane sensor
MSGASADARAAAAEWLARRDRGDWCGADQAALDAWLAQSWSHTVAFWRLDAAWNRADRLGALRQQKNESVLPRRAPVWPLLFRTAAALVLVAILGWAATQFVNKPQVERSYATAIGGHEIVSFADGSRIQLNTNTVLRARMTTAERAIWLDKGEAYFEVKHDPAHPFVVYADGRRITDLGTNFLVRRDPATLEVALIKGSVRVGAAGSQSASRLLKPGDVAVASAESMVITKKTARELSDELSWRRGVLVFDNVPLAEVAAELNRYNRQKLVIADAGVANLAVAGTFRTDDVQGFTDIVRAVFKLHVSNKGSDIVISR